MKKDRARALCVGEATEEGPIHLSTFLSDCLHSDNHWDGTEMLGTDEKCGHSVDEVT